MMLPLVATLRPDLVTVNMTKMCEHLFSTKIEEEIRDQIRSQSGRGAHRCSPNTNDSFYYRFQKIFIFYFFKTVEIAAFMTPSLVFFQYYIVKSE